MSTTVVCRPTSGTFIRPDNLGKNYYASAKSKQAVQNFAPGGYAFVVTTLPAELADRTVLSATLQLTMEPGTGSRTLKVQRHAKPDTAYSAMTGNNDPGVLAGSTEVSVTQDSADTLWEFDVTDDLADTAGGDPFYGFRISTTYTSIWWMLGWGSATPPLLIVELADESGAAEGLRPDGVVGLAAPVLTWLAPDQINAARIQTDEVGGDFSSPVWTSGWQSTTIPQLDTSAVTGWTNLTDGASIQVRVEHDVDDVGPTGWSDPVTLERDAYPTLTVSAPTSTTTDPTPTVTWSFSGQVAYQVTLSVNGVTVADSGYTPGSATSWTPSAGATASGQVITRRVRTWDRFDRTPSPGDPGYVESTGTTTYTPGSATAISSLVVTQDGIRPWVDLVWTRTGTPNEWIVERDIGDGYVIIDRFDGTSGGSPVLSYRDYTCPPNRDVEYRVRPVVSGAAGAVGPTDSIRMAVTGAWVVDVDDLKWFTFGGQDLSLSLAESSVMYETTGSTVLKRTFALRGYEGSIGGTMRDLDGRTVEEYERDLYAIKGQPNLEVRLVFGDQNIPAMLTGISSVIHPTLATTERIIKSVTIADVRQTGEFPYPAVTP